MTATEELRRLLDERGVEWSKPADEYWELLGGAPTSDCVTIVGETSIDEATDGTLVVCRVTPAQAVEATLGRGECRPLLCDNLTETCGNGDAWAECSVCGAMLAVLTETDKMPNYCPNCGAKVVQ